MADEDQGLENTDGEFSLADLAGLDISGIEEIRSERLPIGLYVFRGKKATLTETTNRDDEKRYVAEVTLEVAEVKALIEKDRGDESSLVGKTFTERFYIVPEKAQEGIGRIRGWYTDVGLDSAGPLGGLTEDGGAPGVLDRIVDHLFPAKIIGRKKEGETYARLQLPTKKK